MFKWSVLFAVIAVFSSFIGMNDVAGITTELACLSLFFALIFSLIAVLRRPQKPQYTPRRHRA